MANKVITADCPHCKKETQLSFECSSWKLFGYVLNGWISGGKKQVMQDAVLVTTAQHAQNLQCLSCNQIVHQCPSCNKILPYFNSGNCSECGALIA